MKQRVAGKSSKEDCAGPQQIINYSNFINLHRLWNISSNYSSADLRNVSVYTTSLGHCTEVFELTKI